MSKRSPGIRSQRRSAVRLKALGSQLKAALLLGPGPQSGRCKPFAHAGAGFGLSCFADQIIAFCARW